MSTLDADVEAAWQSKVDYQVASDARMVTTAVNAVRLLILERYSDAATLQLNDVNDLYLVPALILDKDANVLWTAEHVSPDDSWLYDEMLRCVTVIDRYTSGALRTIDLSRKHSR